MQKASGVRLMSFSEPPTAQPKDDLTLPPACAFLALGQKPSEEGFEKGEMHDCGRRKPCHASQLKYQLLGGENGSRDFFFSLQG